ncbi:unnamed protein product, partial [Nesidiocoris tenuis]
MIRQVFAERGRRRHKSGESEPAAPPPRSCSEHLRRDILRDRYASESEICLSTGMKLGAELPPPLVFLPPVLSLFHHVLAQFAC